MKSRERWSPEVTSNVGEGTEPRHVVTVVVRHQRLARPPSAPASLPPLPALVTSLLSALAVLGVSWASFVLLVFIHDLLVLQPHLGQQSFGFLYRCVLTGCLLLCVIH